jgi:hypothetical protein
MSLLLLFGGAGAGAAAVKPKTLLTLGVGLLGMVTFLG